MARSWTDAIYALILRGTIDPSHLGAATDHARAHHGVVTRVHGHEAAIVEAAVAARALAVAITRAVNVATRAAAAVTTRVAARAVSADHEAAHDHKTRPTKTLLFTLSS